MTGISLYVLAFAVALVRVFFRASQQLAVVNFLWLRIPINSYGMSFGDALLWGGAGIVAINDGLWALLAYGFVTGTAGWIGCYLAMWLHNDG